MNAHVEQFRSEIRAAGLSPPDEIVADGKLRRFASNGKRSDDAGWYILHSDGIPAGSFGDWRTGVSQTWRAELGRRLSPAEADALRRKADADRQQREAEERKRQEDARKRAAALWEGALAAPVDHPYLLAKGCKPHGLRVHDGSLLVPVREGVETHSLQVIDGEGDKRFLPGGRVRGCYFSIGGKPNGRLCVVEGFATGASVHECTGSAVAVAFNAGNLEAVARQMRARFPELPLVICADDDVATPGNPGLAKAIEAARAVGGLLAVPDFGPDRPDGATDFNDLARHRGVEVVIGSLANARAPDVQPATDSAIAGALSGPRVCLTRGDAIKPEAVRWIWRDWLARGKLHVLAGAAGTGKTTLALAMAATVTNAGRWPDAARCEAGTVVMWSGEDDPADTLIPRLLAAGADVTRVHFVGAVHDGEGRRTFDPAKDVHLLADRLKECGEVALLIVDPIVSAVASDSHKNGEVRRSLQPLVDVAALHGCALLGITHYTKGTAGRDPLERVTGSLAFGALPRVVMGTAKPTEPGAMRRLVRAKSNIGPDGGGFEYDLEQAEVPNRGGLFASRVLWGQPVDGTARELLAEVETEPDDEESGARDEASAWLRDRLAVGSVPAGDIKREAERNGLAWRTVQRARIAIAAQTHREGFGKGSTVVWSLSSASTIDAKKPIGATQNDLASMGKFGAYADGDSQANPGEVF